MENIILETVDLSFIYPDETQALNKVNIQIEKGEKIAIMGANGAGKSTLFSHFNGLTEPTSGHLKIQGKIMEYDKQSLLEIRQKVGVVFQNPDDQLFAPSVREDVAFGPMNLGLDLDEVDKRVDEALKLVNMEGFEEKAPHHLSGGQQKRISIAGIIAMYPEIMILDEPTAGLDPQGVDQVLYILNYLNEKGMTLVVSSHDVEMITEFADKVIVLDHGKVIAQGTTEEVFSNHELLKQAHLKPPKSSELLKKLKDNGLDLKTNKLTIDEACIEILNAKIKKGE